MPTFLHGKNTRVLFANPTANTTYDLSPFFNDLGISRATEATETTAFQNGGVKTYIVGLSEGTLSMSGMYEGSATGIDAIMNEAFASDKDDAVVAFPDGGTATSTTYPDARCYMARGLETKYDLKSPVSGVVAIDAEIQADGGVWHGKGQYIPSSIATGSTTLATPARAHTSSTNNGGLVVIGLLTLSGTISARLQHSDDGVSWVDLGTPVTSVGTSVLVLTGTIKQYTRLYYPLGSTSNSATIYFGFARY
jgi:hypothetical protein